MCKEDPAFMLIVRQLDALSRFRFRSDAASLAAWKCQGAKADSSFGPFTAFRVTPISSPRLLAAVPPYRPAGNFTVHLVSNPPRTLYRVLTSSFCGSSSLNRSSAILAVACS